MPARYTKGLIQELELADAINRAAIANASLEETGKLVLDAYFKLAAIQIGRYHSYDDKSITYIVIRERVDSRLSKLFFERTGIELRNFITSLKPSETLANSVARGRVSVSRSERSMRKLLDEQLQGTSMHNQVRKIHNAMGLQTVVIIPLKSNSRIFGLVTLGSTRILNQSAVNRLKRFTRSITAALTKTAAEDEVRRQREFTFELLDSLPADLALFDESHRYLYVNSKGIQNETVRKWIIGKDDFEYCQFRGLDESLAVRRRKRFMEALSGRTNQFWIDVHTTASGDERHIMRMFHPVFGDNRFKYMVGYGVDITDRVRAELENRKLAEVVENSNDAIISSSPQGIVLTWNKGAEHLFGYSSSEIVGKSIDCFVPEDKMDELNKLRDRVKAGLTQSLITVRTHKDGSRIDISLALFPLRDELGNVTALSAILRDMREQKRIEEEHVRLIRDLTHKYNELMQFNYIVSHNLRAPVTKILGLANVLKLPLSADEREKINQHMVQSVESMDVLIKDLGAILAARTPIHEKIETFALTSILETVQDNLERPIRDSDARVVLAIDPAADIMTSIKSYIQSVMFNLISNSIKYKARDRSPVVVITAARNGPRIIIRVEDNGQGIDTERYKDHLFGLYKRFSNDAEGKGLGLHMTKTQIESLGGEISVDGRPGHGTIFTISLPEAEIPIEVAPV